MSTSEPGAAPSGFDAWVAVELGRQGPFTALVVLVGIGPLTVTPLASTWLHVVGRELDWRGVAELLDGARVAWDGAVFGPRRGLDGGPLPDAAARITLRDFGSELIADRSRINGEHFFDRRGRRMKVEEVTAQ